jgi:hypothetical protein
VVIRILSRNRLPAVANLLRGIRSNHQQPQLLKAMKNSFRIVLAGLMTTALVLAPAVGLAQDKSKTPPAANAETKPAPGARAIPFRGTVTALDKTAMTVTVGERVFHISSETRLMKNTQPGTFADINIGDNITGNYVKEDDGKLTAKMARFGPRPDKEAGPGKKDKSAEKNKVNGE